MENLELTNLFGNIYQGKTVLVTGHTGFKGSWLALWLKEMGAEVVGYSLSPPTDPNHYELLGLEIKSVIGDIRDQNRLDQVFGDSKPDIVFHLAAQPLVRLSYQQPDMTFETNVMGTVRVMEACRKTPSVRAVICITSDKCYENREWFWGYRENDPMGGYDPYSASKGCAELAVSAYRNSFFDMDTFGKKHHVLLASARAGNVIGGGDWAKDRLIPDMVSASSENRKVIIRSPDAIRPWQHVLEPLSGYLLIGQKLLEGNRTFAESWNFGPGDDGTLKVGDVVKIAVRHWEKILYEIQSSETVPLHEAKLLKLDCSKARFRLGWKNIWNIEKSVEKTVMWYRHFYENRTILTRQNLYEYINDAKHLFGGAV